MSRPTKLDLEFIDRLARATKQFAQPASAMGYQRHEIGLDGYRIICFPGNSTIVYRKVEGCEGLDPNKDITPIFSYDHTTLEIRLRSERYMNEVTDILKRMLVLEELSDV